MMPRLNLPRLRPTVAPRPTVVPRPPTVVPKPPEVTTGPRPSGTIAPKRPDPLPTQPEPTGPRPNGTIAPEPPDPLPTKPEVGPRPNGTIAPEPPDPLPTKPKSTIITQSGDDWGTEDDDDMFGTDIMNMDPNSPEFAAAVQADTDAGPPKIPGGLDENNWSSDFTDSGQQTSYDPEDTDDGDEDAEIRVGGGIGIAAPGVNMGIRQLQDEGSKVSSGNLRRNIRKLSPSLISAKA